MEPCNCGKCMTCLFGEPISVYTRAQAIEDGTLVDLSKVAPDVCAQHYKVSVACTAAVWGVIDRAVKNPRCLNDVNGVVHDVLWMSKVCAQVVDTSTRLFKVIIRGAGRKSSYVFKAVVGPGDSGECVLTISEPDES